VTGHGEPVGQPEALFGTFMRSHANSDLEADPTISDVEKDCIEIDRALEVN
jgi:hypothetical protein